jgi:hypothetical protein
VLQEEIRYSLGLLCCLSGCFNEGEDLDLLCLADLLSLCGRFKNIAIVTADLSPIVVSAMSMLYDGDPLSI